MAAVAGFDAGVVKAQNITQLDHPTYVKLVKRWGAAQNYLLKDRDGDGAAPRRSRRARRRRRRRRPQAKYVTASMCLR